MSAALRPSLALLIACAGQGCVQLPALTLGLSSHLHARANGSVVASAFAIGAALGWRARSSLGVEATALDRPRRADALAASRTLQAPLPCAFASVCLWEDSERSAALRQLSTISEDEP